MQEQLLSHLYVEGDERNGMHSSRRNDDEGERDEMMDVRGRRIGELKGNFCREVVPFEVSC